MWNDACNDWALSFNEYSDIMVESKFKNLASIELYNYANTRKDLLQRSSIGHAHVQQQTDWAPNETVAIA
jgi:hypothetical protein